MLAEPSGVEAQHLAEWLGNQLLLNHRRRHSHEELGNTLMEYGKDHVPVR